MTTRRIDCIGHRILHNQAGQWGEGEDGTGTSGNSTVLDPEIAVEESSRCSLLASNRVGGVVLCFKTRAWVYRVGEESKRVKVLGGSLMLTLLGR